MSSTIIAAVVLSQFLQVSLQATGTAMKRQLPDCNGNGMPDSVEISMGLTADCDGDGVPDECQLATEHVYRHDDGTYDLPVPWSATYVCWLAQHEVVPGHEFVTAIEIGRCEIPSDLPVTVGLWSDPDGSLDPVGILPLLILETTLSWEQGQNVLRLDVPKTLVGPPGSSFFVGVLGAFDPFDKPLPADFGGPSFKSWIISSTEAIHPDEPWAGAFQVAAITNADWTLRALSCPGGHCGEMTDHDFDGIPDACQLQDCNGNSIPDEQDIALGLSADCQGDGIPDECQTDPGTVVYAYDEGSGNAVGTNHSWYAWLSPYVVQPGGEVITDFELTFGYMEPSNEVTLCLWSDPNGDGDPTDAQLIAGYTTHSVLEGSGKYVVVNIPDTYVGPPGTPFFLGAYGFFEWDPQGTTWYAAPFDPDDPDLTAWFVSADQPIDLNDLSAGAAEFGRLNTVCSCDGDWSIRGITCATGHCLESADLNANSIPDDCEPDCNGNGVPDDLDVVTGVATDCDGNGVLDVCDGLVDCDANGIADLCQFVTPTGLVASYYASKDLSGEPVGRLEPGIDHDFATSPPPEIQPFNFSVRWTGSILTAVSGAHAFEVQHEGGVRLWINGKLVVDAWSATGTGVLVSQNTIALDGGAEYQLRLEYRHAGAGSVQLSWQQPGGSMLLVDPSETRPTYDRDHDGVPDVCELASDCNDNLVEDLDDISSGTSLDCDGDLVPDDCQRCQDKDGNGWLDACEPSAGPGLVGQYFLLDPATDEFRWRSVSTIDPALSFDWGGSSPTGVPVDAFGARWTGTLTTPATSGTYAFHLDADDGARLWIDGLLLIDAWNAPGVHSTNLALAASSAHLLRVDYRETGGNAHCELRWTVPGGVEAVVPTGALSPDTDIDADGVPDEATSDCNMNGIPDALDVDLDGNCVPDDCEAGAGYWRFEEPGGSIALDSSPSGIDGTLNPYPTRVTDVPVSVVPQTGESNLQALDNDFVGSVRVLDQGGVLSVPDTSFTLEAWVKQLILSTPNSANQRQWLFMKKPLASSDALLEYALLVQAGNLGTTGRELAFRYGDGVDLYVVVSSLEINDYEWHHVSVAYDADRLELRFGIDGVFETRPFDKPAIANVGALLLGAHENVSGQENQWLFGTYDELRFTRAFLPPESLLDHAP